MLKHHDGWTILQCWICIKDLKNIPWNQWIIIIRASSSLSIVNWIDGPHSSFLVRHVFKFNICLLMEKARSFWAGALPSPDLTHVLVNTTGAWDGDISERNAFGMGMCSACLGNVIVRYLTSRGKTEFTGVKICPFLPTISCNPVLNNKKGTLYCLTGKYPRGSLSYVLKWRLSLSDNGLASIVSACLGMEYEKTLLRDEISYALIPSLESSLRFLQIFKHAIETAAKDIRSHQICQWRISY